MAKKTASGEGPNLELWNSLCITPPEYLKQFRRAGGFSGKSIDPVYRIRLLTEKFGPCGKGWGFVQEDQWTESGSGAYVVYVRGHLWYIDPVTGERCATMSHTGGTVCDRAPDEAYKMSETDALGKCCLDLGIAADVYLGVHDGDKYQRDESGPTYTPQSTGRGRAPGSGASQAKPPAKSIEADEVPGILKYIDGLCDEKNAPQRDPEVYDFSRKLFPRLVASKDLPAKDKAAIAEKMAAKRCQTVPAEMIGSLRDTLAAYVKQGWIKEDYSKKIVNVAERRHGVIPGNE